MIKKKITKILVPIDGSKNSFRGLEMAINLARQCNATITGIYSFQTPPHSEFKGMGSIRDAHKKEVKKFMDEAKTLSEQNCIVFNEKIVKGEIGYNIVKLAQGKNKFSMIVIGSRGRSPTKEMFFGSISNYVVHTSKVPVLVVK